MAVSVERWSGIDRVDERGDMMTPQAIVSELKPKTEAQDSAPPDLGYFYVPGLPVVRYMLGKLIDGCIEWFEKVSDKHTTSDYNPLE